jgi:hypothetical protein
MDFSIYYVCIFKEFLIFNIFTTFISTTFISTTFISTTFISTTFILLFKYFKIRS